MDASMALRRRDWTIPIAWWLAALAAAFALGIVSGFAAKSASAPAQSGATSLCQVGTHPVVWYSAYTWSCVADS